MSLYSVKHCHGFSQGCAITVAMVVLVVVGWLCERYTGAEIGSTLFNRWKVGSVCICINVFVRSFVFVFVCVFVCAFVVVVCERCSRGEIGSILLGGEEGEEEEPGVNSGQE